MACDWYNTLSVDKLPLTFFFCKCDQLKINIASCLFKPPMFKQTNIANTHNMINIPFRLRFVWLWQCYHILAKINCFHVIKTCIMHNYNGYSYFDNSRNVVFIILPASINNYINLQVCCN